MPSLTRKHYNKHQHNERTCGTIRKRKLRKGTTPRFPIHIEDAPDCVVPRPPASGDKD